MKEIRQDVAEDMVNLLKMILESEDDSLQDGGCILGEFYRKQIQDALSELGIKTRFDYNEEEDA
ncbi:MAG TPA: hypothetical protein ACFYEK_05955 [Candidatus Wunengus sp. YC60]|uniref:hypothetical protein n=1 Tax=Candidatus Wunengus sp. YC60 TaxID=3367697 RepID=UPI00402698B3